MTCFERRSGRIGRWGWLLLVAAACTQGDSLSPTLEPPAVVSATPLGQTSIRIEWTPGAVVELEKYRIERRVNLTGRFRTLVEVDPNSTTYFDTGLDPETFYGYRIVALSRTGDPSRPSVVAGAATAGRPGLRIVTALGGATPVATADPNGYLVAVTGPMDTTFSVGTLGDLVISPLPAGSYTVTLRDILPTCAIASDTVRDALVVDTGLTTRTVVSFTASCLDPTRGQIVVVAEVQGDSVDGDGYQVEFQGIIPGDPVPVFGTGSLTGAGDTLAFGNLRPGDYQVSLGDVEAPCTVAGGSTQQDVRIEALASDTLTFAITCVDRGGGNPDAPMVYRNLWSPQTASNGQTVTLDVVLDGTALPSQTIGAVQAELRYNPALLTFLSASNPATQMSNITVNSGAAGVLVWGNYSTLAPSPTGAVPAARFTFQVSGTSGSVNTRTAIQTIADGDFSVILDTLFRVVEDTLTISAGGPSNVPPSAEAGGPYAGVAGGPINFSSAGSSDVDGTLVGYSWSFSDGGSSAQQNPAKAFPAAGSYTATLTVTDDDGATDSDQAIVTVSTSSGNQAPVAQANGPYAGTAATAITFSSAGSTDPDGTITTYNWSFGDNTSSTTANPTKAYATAGTYAVGLTVTDNLGATATAQATATISGSGATGPAWTSTFGPFDGAFQAYPLVVTLDLTQDVSQTPGSEAVQSFVVDSLVWDPAVLQYHALLFGSGGGSFNTTEAVGGCHCKLSFSGTPTANTGVVTIARVLFKPIGPPGSSVTTKSAIGPVLSTPAAGSFNYRPLLQIVEGTLTLP